jgi:hypothetical protein
MAILPAFWRIDEYVKAANGYAMANGQVFFCTQPANTMAFPPSPLATLYADPFGLTPISQPLIADGFGHVDAYVAAGTYTQTNPTVYPVHKCCSKPMVYLILIKAS